MFEPMRSALAFSTLLLSIILTSTSPTESLSCETFKDGYKCAAASGDTQQFKATLKNLSPDSDVKLDFVNFVNDCSHPPPWNPAQRPSGKELTVPKGGTIKVSLEPTSREGHCSKGIFKNCRPNSGARTNCAQLIKVT